MNKILRFSLVCLLAVFCGSVNAQVWEEDWSDYKDYVKADLSGMNANYSFEGTTYKDDGSYKGGTGLYDETLAGGEAPELLIAKNGGYFSATISVGSATEMTLSFKCNKNIDVTADGAEVGEAENTGNDYSYTITASASTITLTFTNNLSANCRLDNIKLVEGTPTTKPAGLSWGTSSRTVTIGEENTFPTLSNENNLPVTYKSSDTGVATINSSGDITLVAAGKTTISASFAGNSEFEAETVSYELTVKEAASGDEATIVTVAEALNLINALGTEKTAYVDDKAPFIVYGYIVEIEEMSPKPDGYGNATFTIADTKGGSEVIKVFRCKDIDNANFEDADKIKVDDLVAVTGALQMYVKDGVCTPEVSGPSGGPSCHLLSINDLSGVNALTVNKNSNAPIYNMAGQRVNKAVKGVYIQNGKKFVVK
ncbi:MAG: hypothetical protein J5506_10485 [Prevotella sp.]|nr:hypothetical protein [Prevotella sp.]